MNAALQDEQATRVVIIDDTEDLRDLLRLALSRGGMEVVREAGDGLAGIEAVRVGQPDVVLLDLSMPVMDGLEALPHLRALVPSAKIIVLSGFGANAMAERAIAIGADGYLQKGMSLGRILDRVREITATRSPDGVAAPALRVVPSAPAPPDGGESVDRLAPSGGTLPEALTRSPHGVLEVEQAPPFRVIHANPAAQQLLGHEALPGAQLADISTELTQMVDSHLASGRTEYSATIAGNGVQVDVRRASQTLLLYLEPSSDEVEALRHVLAVTAHEIRGPVGVLCALAETIDHQAGSADPTERERLMASVARQARVLDGITADLLTAAQVQRGVLRVEAQPVDPAEVIGAVVDDHQLPISIEVLDRRRIVADPLRLEQMIGNLIRNAAKYARPPIVVRVRRHDDHDGLVNIDVHDGGDGVPAHFRERLFGEFAQASESSTGGIGLGLHVVRTLAEAQGGSVSYAPGVDGGAVFTITLPTA
jgi:signal transduction histidine kinase